MSVNLYGEYYTTPEEIATALLKESQNQQRYNLVQSTGTKQGIRLASSDGDIDLFRTGFYIIYHGETPVYVGYSMNSIYSRLSRFVKEINGNSALTETHSAAKKYRFLYGRTTNDLTVSILPYTERHTSIINAIEKNIILKINPSLNKKR